MTDPPQLSRRVNGPHSLTGMEPLIKSEHSQRVHKRHQAFHKAYRKKRFDDLLLLMSEGQQMRFKAFCARSMARQAGVPITGLFATWLEAPTTGLAEAIQFKSLSTRNRIQHLLYSSLPLSTMDFAKAMLRIGSYIELNERPIRRMYLRAAYTILLQG